MFFKKDNQILIDKNIESQSTDIIAHRDQLAINRTKLANERTLLAYLRTGLMFFLSAISILKLFSDDVFLVWLAYFLIPSSIIITIYGSYRYRKVSNKILEFFT